MISLIRNSLTVLAVIVSLSLFTFPVLVLAEDSPKIEENDAVLGSADAQVTIVAFLDLECPNSRKLYPSLRTIHEKFPDQVRVAIKFFPLPVYENSRRMAENGQCLISKGKFFEFADMVYGEHFRCLECVDGMLDGLGVDKGQHAACMKDPENAKAVASDVEYGKSLGVSATPTMFINGEMIEGAITYRQLAFRVRALLK